MPLSRDEARPLATGIANGHAWAEHRDDFPAVSDAAAFALFIESILTTPDAERALARGRTAYWRSESGTIVLLNPNAPDGGTCFKPGDGMRYFESIG